MTPHTAYIAKMKTQLDELNLKMNELDAKAAEAKAAGEEKAAEAKPAAAKPAAPAAPAATGGGVGVQVGAFSSHAAAEAAWPRHTVCTCGLTNCIVS